MKRIPIRVPFSVALRPGRIKARFADFRDSRSGATMVEYGVLAAILGIGLVVSFVLMSDRVNAPMETVNDEIVEHMDPIDRP